MDKQDTERRLRLERHWIVPAQCGNAAFQIPSRERFGLRVSRSGVQDRGQQVGIAESLPIVGAAQPGVQ